MPVDFESAVSAYNKAAKVARDAAKGNTDTLLQNSNTSNQQSAFGELVRSALNDAKDTGYKSEAVSMAALAGKADLQDMVTAITNAELTLQTVIAVRDKVINAYQDILKMPI